MSSNTDGSTPSRKTTPIPGADRPDRRQPPRISPRQRLRDLILLCFFLFSSTGVTDVADSPLLGCEKGDTASRTSIDNSALMPPYKPDPLVELEGLSPEWVKSLIMVQLRIETATLEGTFQSATRVLDHYSQMGVNGLWINPIYERGSKGNGYLNFGLHTIEPLLTGTSNTEESLDVVKAFVDEAHQRNIRVLLDIVVWGTAKNSHLVTDRPEFYRKSDSGFVEVWGGYAFDWNNVSLRTWFKRHAIELIQKTGADGFRVDLAPDTSGYFFEEVRKELLDLGHKIAIVSEMNGERRAAFDFEQVGVHGWTEEPDYITPGVFETQKKRFGNHNDFLLRSNIVEVVRSGTGIGKAELQKRGEGGNYRFYTSNLLNHDDRAVFVRGSRLKFGYTALFAPFIPMWWIGEEWNNPESPLPDSDGAIYFNRIDWGTKAHPENRAFFEDVKRMIRIRRSYPDLFEHFPARLRDSNIFAVHSSVSGSRQALQAYGRRGDQRSAIIVPGHGGDRPVQVRVEIDRQAMGLSDTDAIAIVELMSLGSSEPIRQRDQEVVFVTVPPESVAIILVTKME